jgi:hypothetical protein
VGGEQVVDEIVRRILHHLDLLQHHTLLPLQLIGVEARVQQDVGEEVHGQREMLVQDLHVEARVLLGGEGIHLPPHRIHGSGNLLGAAGGRPLENQVLDEVRDAGPLIGLVARARLHPDADGDRADVGHLLRDDPDAVGQQALPVLFSHGAGSPRWGS